MKMVCLVGLLPFPEGGGATSRLRSFALGLAEAGVPVEVLAYGCKYDAGIASIERREDWRGVPTRTYTHSESFIPSRLRLRRLRWRENEAILKRLEQCCEEGRVRAVFLYSQEPGFALEVIRVCRRWRVPFVQQYAELHWRADVGRGVPWPHFLREQIHMKMIPRLADGAVVISRFLQERCARISRAPILYVPALTNTELQLELPRRRDVSFTVTYLGAGARRDCLPELLAGFRRFHRDHVGCRLQLLGLGGQMAGRLRLELAQIGLVESTRVETWSSPAELLAAVAETDAFVLLRSDDPSSWACFPTRLPEFLLHERPVLMNAVGDAASLLSPEREYAPVRSLAPEDLAAAMAALHRDPARRLALARAGAEAAEREFGYRRWGRELAAFFERLPA